MSNSLEDILVGAYRALIIDIESRCPDSVDLSRDMLRLTALMSERGLACLMLDLPALDKILLDGLETGLLKPSGPLTRLVSKVSRVPRLFSGLWLRIFHRNGCLRGSPCVDSIAFLRQIFCLAKKIEINCKASTTKSVVEEYFHVDQNLREPHLNWGGHRLDSDFSTGSVHFCDGLDTSIVSPSKREYLAELCDKLQGVCDSVSGYLGYYDPFLFTEEVRTAVPGKRYLRHGRGAVSDMKRNNCRYKFTSWPDKLDDVFDYASFAVHDFSSNDDIPNTQHTSKLCAVPKDLSKPRLIASEPGYNQWCQQITLAWLLDRISKTPLHNFINLKRQDLSQKLVVSSSRDQSLSTVDLSSASDRLSCWAVERAFRKNRSLLYALHAHRTPHIRDGVYGSHEQHSLKKFATQGTAVTFPVQTIFFLCVVAAALGCRNLSELKDCYAGQVRVYGDDIILPVSGYQRLRVLMDYLELKVNEGKSFVAGKFRESCGMDAYDGFDVTPIKPTRYVGTGPTSLQASIDNVNNFFMKGYWNLSNYLLKATGVSRLYLPFVQLGSGVTGIATYSGTSTNHLKSRWNEDLQCPEYLVSSFVAKVDRVPYDDSRGILQYFAENPIPDTKWESGLAGVPSTKMVRQWVSHI